MAKDSRRTDRADPSSLPRLNRRRLLGAGVSAGAGAALLPGQGRARSAPPGEVRRYARLGRTGLMISDISFGSSRLRRGEEKLVHHALDRGVNYFDAADSYSGGASEITLGRALKGRRDEVVIISKTKSWADTRREELMSALEGSLRRLQTDYLDVYFNHAVNDLERLENPEWFEFVERAREQGKIRFTGMSGHAGYLIDCLNRAIDEDLFDVFLVAYNFGQDPEFYESLVRSMNRIATQAGLPAVLARAKKKDIGITTMKVLRGARLNDMRPYETEGSTFAQAAFRWVLANPNVDAAVISMTSTELIDEYLGASGADGLAAGDRALLERYASLTATSYCQHACHDCAGACPFEVPIGEVLRSRMYATDYRDVDFARREYAELPVNAAACLECSGAPCRDACSHGLPIAELCAPTHRMLA